jgi:hypothetical protein
MRAILRLASLTLAAMIGVAHGADTGSAASAAQPSTKGPGSSAATVAPTAKTGRGAADRSGEKAPYQGPTETDIRSAYRLRVDRINEGSDRFLDREAAARLHLRLVKVDFVECNPIGERTDLYLCSILVESALGDGDSEFKRMEATMAKEGQTWVLR